MRGLDARAAAVIRVDAVWLAVEPLDMRSGSEAALARVVNVFGSARPHHAYLFANRRANRIKVLVHDGIGVWLTAQRQKVPEGSATAKAIDYTLGRWQALTRYIDNGDLPADNNWVENQTRPIAIGRSNWLFGGSLRAGQRAAAIMSLLHSARLNGHDPFAYLRDVLERLPTQAASRIDELLAHRWQRASTVPPS